MEWIEAHPELAVAIFGPVCVALGYLFRMRTERRQNLREALYLLLEIWHRVSILTSHSPEQLIDVLVSRIKAAFPGAVITSEELAATKAYFSPILRRVVRAHALEDVDGLQAAYQRVITLVARTHPIYAYELEAAAHTKRRLAFLDQYFDEAYSPLEQQGGLAAAFTASLRHHVSARAERDSAKELERSLRGLALRDGISSLLRVHLLIEKRHRRLRSSPTDDIDLLIEEILKPVVRDPKLASLFPQQETSSAMPDEKA